MSHLVFNTPPFVVLFSIIALGLALGRLSVKGISFGASAVIFVALAFGHFGFTIPHGIGTMGLVIFVFCVGITAGPGFFSAFASKGAKLAKLSVLAVLSGVLTAWLAARLLDIPSSLAAGLFAGAMTSTPGLAAAMEAVSSDPGLVAVGYGIAYPFGVIGVVLFIQLIPKIFGKDLVLEAESLSSEKAAGGIKRMLVKFTKPGFEGRPVSGEGTLLDKIGCCVSRVLSDDKLQPVAPDTCFKMDSIYLLVGEESHLAEAVRMLGEETRREAILDADNERMQIAVTSRELDRKRIEDLRPLTRHGVIISRITRHDVTFVPDSSMRIEYGDILTVVGSPANLHAFAKLAGNRHKLLHKTELISLCAGIVIGTFVGMLPIPLPGVKTFSLGLAGGPLLVALLLGHFKRIGFLSVRMPTASRLMLMELGLLFFLADAGMKAGGEIQGILKEHGLMLFAAGAAICIVPMLFCYAVAVKLLKLDILEAFGGICGGMTSTPALGALTAKVDSEIPVSSYATAYPVALIMMIFGAQLLVFLLGG